MKYDFLTAEKKVYYMNDFNNNVIPCNDKFWEISPSLKSILIKINENPKIQSLYSHRKDFTDSLSDDSSLTITYTKDLHTKLNDSILPEIKDQFNKDGQELVSTFFRGPIEKKPAMASEGCKLASRTDPNYWKINHLRIDIKTNDQSIDDEFWTTLQNTLFEIN